MSPPKTAFSSLYVPVINIPAADLHLRPEFIALLPYANLEPRHLITLDDLPSLEDIETILKAENTRWILVDHNALQGKLGSAYAGRVHGVVDHHTDEGKVRKDTEPEPRVIDNSGSCTSLVTEYVRNTWDAFSSLLLSTGAAHAQSDAIKDDAATGNLWDAQVAQLALASVLVDTSNLQSTYKTTKHDVDAVHYLESKILGCRQISPSFKRQAFYERIDSSRKDIENLRLDDILRKDYKEWSNNRGKLGISAVVKPIPFLVQKAGSESHKDGQESSKAFLESAHSFAIDRQLSVYAIMTTSTSPEGKFQRELFLWGLDSDGIASAKQFSSFANQRLGLKPWTDSKAPLDNESDDSSWRRIWWQEQVENSRKQVAPLLREAMK
jgi:exopolyphosphatase